MEPSHDLQSLVIRHSQNNKLILNKSKNVNKISNYYLELQCVVILKFHSNRNNFLKETLEENMYCTAVYVTVFKLMFTFNLTDLLNTVVLLLFTLMF
jgi:hypothetical protein